MKLYKPNFRPIRVLTLPAGCRPIRVLTLPAGCHYTIPDHTITVYKE